MVFFISGIKMDVNNLRPRISVSERIQYINIIKSEVLSKTYNIEDSVEKLSDEVSRRLVDIIA